MSEMDPNTTPALEPPGDLSSDFINPPTLMPASIGVTTTVLALMTSFVAARLFIKFKIVHENHIEDYLCYIAYCGVVAWAGVFLYAEADGLARHQWDITITQFIHLGYFVNIIYCIYGPTTAFAKLSVLFQIKRIFTTKTKGTVYWVIIVSIVANTIAYTGLFFSYVFQCWPREAIWNPTVPARCLDSNKSNLAAGILNLISDIEALLLPAWAIWHMRMPIKRKLSVYAVFAVGAIASAIGIAGIAIRVRLLNEKDFSWIGSILGILVVSEMSMVVIVGCCPALPRLYHYLRGNPDGRSQRASYQPQNSSQNYPKGKSNSHFGLSSVAKYMSPGMTKLESMPSDERIELRRPSDSENGEGKYLAEPRNGILKTVQMDQSSMKDDAV